MCVCVMLILMRQEPSSVSFSAFAFVCLNVYIFFSDSILSVSTFGLFFSSLSLTVAYISYAVFAHFGLQAKVDMNMAFEYELCARNRTVGFAPIQHIYDYPSSFAPFQILIKKRKKNTYTDMESETEKMENSGHICSSLLHDILAKSLNYVMK